MPRIKAVKVSAFNEVQDVSDDKTLAITRYPSSDLERAVNEDYPIDPFGDTSASDLFHMLEAGAPFTAAGMLSGATEVAHIDAVIYGHRFNGTLPMDPRRNVYESPDWETWQRYHDEHGRKCPSCETYNYCVGPDDLCGNCLAKLGYNVGEEVSFDANYLDPEAPYVSVDGKVINVSEWDDKESDEPIQWLDIQVITARVKPHTARMTGASWWIVEVDGCQSGPYYDDHDDAQSTADKINEGAEILRRIRSDYLG